MAASSPFHFAGLPRSVGQHLRPKLPLSRVELHIHLDGSPRPETIWEISKGQGLSPATNSLKHLKENLSIQEPKSLAHFLEKFGLIVPPFVGQSRLD